MQWKKWTVAVVLALSLGASCAWAAQNGATPVSQSTIDGAAQAWQKNGQAAGLVGTNGKVMYAYGESRPVIECSPLHLCVIELIKGEKVTDLSIGDSVRWKLASSAAGEQPVVVVKPVAPGLETNLTVMTDAGRVYYMTLRSTTTHYIPLVGFYDPQALITHVNEQAQAVRYAQERKDATLGNVDPASLDFGYSCHGDAPFAPAQVFSGAGHVYLKMPEAMQYGDAPAVFDTTKGRLELLNSRLVHGYEVIDGLPEKFRLVSGVGHGAQTVDCGHKEHRISSLFGDSRP